MFIETSTVGPSSAIIPTQLSSAVACGYIMWLLQKAQSVPWISQATTRLNIFMRLIASGISTLGITIAWQSSSHTLIIGNLTTAVVLTGLYHLGVQYATTHGFEKLMNILPSTAVPAPGDVVPTTKAAPDKV